jgi:hypothetical protein
MKTRNKVRLTKNGNYSKVGLSEDAKLSLSSARREISFDPSYMADELNLTKAFYDDEENDVYFRPILTGWENGIKAEII